MRCDQLYTEMNDGLSTAHSAGHRGSGACHQYYTIFIIIAINITKLQYYGWNIRVIVFNFINCAVIHTDDQVEKQLTRFCWPLLLSTTPPKHTKRRRQWCGGRVMLIAIDYVLAKIIYSIIRALNVMMSDRMMAAPSRINNIIAISRGAKTIWNRVWNITFCLREPSRAIILAELLNYSHRRRFGVFSRAKH